MIEFAAVPIKVSPLTLLDTLDVALLSRCPFHSVCSPLWRALYHSVRDNVPRILRSGRIAMFYKFEIIEGHSRFHNSLLTLQPNGHIAAYLNPRWTVPQYQRRDAIGYQESRATFYGEPGDIVLRCQRGSGRKGSIHDMPPFER
jgi:hypothetical protein